MSSTDSINYISTGYVFPVLLIPKQKRLSTYQTKTPPPPQVSRNWKREYKRWIVSVIGTQGGAKGETSMSKHSSAPPPLATMSDYVCEELILEIIKRLPPKSLLRFRSLSKSLCSYISSPDFINMHTFQSPQKILFAHVNNSDNIVYTLHGEDELPLCLCPERGYIGITTTTASFPCKPSFRIVGSCNGTFCLRTEKHLILWNPSIRRKLNVPECECPEIPVSERSFAMFGFGFDPISDDYKIVRVSYAKVGSYVYAVKTGTWCEISSPKPRFSFVASEAFLFNGVLHWVVCVHDYDKESQYNNLPDDYILTFDLSTHVFGIIPLHGPPRHSFSTGLTTIQDSLALISYGTDIDDTWIWVWRDASWSVVFKLGTCQLPIEGALQLQSTNNGDLLLITLGAGLHVYKPTTQVRSRVVNFDAASHLVYFWPFVETLHLLDIGEFACETHLL
ncbi:hypothetical protein L2E82_25800 [Cichorium intybus]|uniref:Uncharacterized protein n=1 Tax=Cichorium intybus TaxID=13427 RepID=A0ACB9E493_CICIN|nr:hypothetical protein L2E82_25800 [Cichorium intybus]